MPPTGQMHFASRGRGAGKWWPAEPHTATFWCPTCGGVHSLIEFQIDSQGGVAPSFVCSYHERDQCFHDSITLVDWE